MFERKSGVFLIAGLLFFGLAFLSNGVAPMLMYADLPEKTAEQLVNGNVRLQFEELARQYPEPFQAAYGKPPESPEERERWWNDKTASALREGRTVYTAEGCWHCHSQFVRPVSNEEQRWGAVSKAHEYQNELQRPVMFGTRRVGPDLSREGGRRSNDWHAVHFFRPHDLAEASPMPDYPWFFDGSPDKPNAKGLAIITYVQWLGSWLESYPYYEDFEQNPILGLEKLQKKTESATKKQDDKKS